jgi:hypothetical protein
MKGREMKPEKTKQFQEFEMVGVTGIEPVTPSV